MSPQNSYVEALTPSVMLYRGGTFGRYLGLADVMRSGAPMVMGLVSFLRVMRDLTACLMRTQEVGSVQPGRQSSSELHDAIVRWDLRIPTSKAMRNEKQISVVYQPVFVVAEAQMEEDNFCFYYKSRANKDLNLLPAYFGNISRFSISMGKNRIHGGGARGV